MKNVVKKWEKLGITGTMVANDWDVCVADGACIEACPVQVFQWYRTDKDISGVDAIKIQAIGQVQVKLRKKNVLITQTKQTLYAKHDCIYCMACVSVCPPQAVLVDQSNMEAHEKAA